MPSTANSWVTKALLNDPDGNRLSLIAEKPDGER